MELKCLRCDGKMIKKKSPFHIYNEKLQLLFPLEVHAYICENCGKVEFYQVGSEYEALYEEQENLETDAFDYSVIDSDLFNLSDTIAQTRCQSCGDVHDMDYPKCPVCGFISPSENINSSDLDERTES